MKTKFNHPQHILKQLPITINERLNKLSGNEEPFNRIQQNYQTALKSANYKFGLTYQNTSNKHKKQRKLKVVYFNPPFSLTEATKIRKEFLKLINHHFDKIHTYYKIFNRNTIKLSYSCMENFKTKIFNHNNKIVNKPTLKKNLQLQSRTMSSK